MSQAQDNLFARHTLSAPRDDLLDQLAHLRRGLTRRWQRRRVVGLIATGVAILSTLAGFYFGEYVLFVGSLAGTLISANFILSRGRALEIEVEVETVELCIALIQALRAMIDPQPNLDAVLDLRSAMQKHPHETSPDRNVGARVRLDHWFTLRVPLTNGYAVAFELAEEVDTRAQFRFRTQSLDRRGLGREYTISLFNDNRCLEDSLEESVISFVAAPSGTTRRVRVIEGAGVFEFVFQILFARHCNDAVSTERPHSDIEMPAARSQYLTRADFQPFDPGAERMD